MRENFLKREIISLNSAKLDKVLDFVKSNEQIKALTKDLKPAEISVNAGKDFVEIKIMLTKNGIRDSKK